MTDPILMPARAFVDDVVSVKLSSRRSPARCGDKINENGQSVPRGHSFVSNDWAGGVTVGVCLRALDVGRRDGRRMSQVRSKSRTSAAPVRNEHDVEARYRDSGGRFVDTPLDRLPVDDVLTGLPVREFRSYKGRRHYSGWYWSATTGGHVVYESRLELARILLADQDSTVVSIAAQPLLLEGFDGERMRSHVPDVLLGHADGTVTVVDVKAGSRLGDPAVVAQFAWTRRVCDERGFRFEVWSGADPVLLENIRFLAGYRRSTLVAEEFVPLVLDAVATSPCTTIADVERRLIEAAAPLVIRPVTLHLLWSVPDFIDTDLVDTDLAA
ncbi:MAG: TnsA-like heteromeric transposase endonuclease subunit [Pseudonocardiaceae bacterium]